MGFFPPFLLNLDLVAYSGLCCCWCPCLLGAEGAQVGAQVSQVFWPGNARLEYVCDQYIEYFPRGLGILDVRG